MESGTTPSAGLEASCRIVNKWHRPVVWGLALVALLEDGDYMGHLPIVWYLSNCDWFLVDVG
jgi:hypothetical protein